MAANPASSRQLSYLRRLADQTGQTFTYPTTSRDASAEIDRLKNTPRQSRAERRIERELSTDHAGVSAGSGTRIHADETTGYGSDATWARTATPRSGSSQATAHQGGWSAPRSASAANWPATPWRPGSGSSTANGSTGSTLFSRRTVSSSTARWAPARTAPVVLVSSVGSLNALTQHDRNDPMSTTTHLGSMRGRSAVARRASGSRLSGIG